MRFLTDGDDLDHRDDVLFFTAMAWNMHDRGFIGSADLDAMVALIDERSPGIAVPQRAIDDPVAEQPVGIAPAAATLTDELERLVELHASGALSDDEFASAKARLLA